MDCKYDVQLHDKCAVQKIEQLSTDHPNQVKKELVDKYLSYFDPQLLSSINAKIEDMSILSMCEKAGIYYTPSSHQSQFLIELVKHSLNWEVVEIIAKWGNFVIPIKILNVLNQNQIHFGMCARGAFGSVYKQQIFGKAYAFKCLQCNQLKNDHCVFYAGVKQYFLTKIASSLHIGPKILSPIGFDLIMYKNCIQFPMQFCQTLDKLNKQAHYDLSCSLYLMHQFGFVHFDIKPENIMWSPVWNKTIFIDYGFSQLVNAKIGQRVYTYFKGTLVYSSQQMVEAFQSRRRQFIDVFTHEAICLSNTFQMMPVSQIQTHALNQESFEQLYGKKPYEIKQVAQNLLYLIKYLLYTNKVSKLASLFDQYRQMIDESLSTSILDFLLEISPSEQLRQFYNQILKSYKKEGLKYKQLNDIYNGQSPQWNHIRIDEQKQGICKFYFSKMSQSFQEQMIPKTSKQIEKMFENQQNRKINPIIYFGLFIDYISFSENVFGTNMNSRLKLTKLLFQNNYLHSQQDVSKMKQLELLSHTILLIYKSLPELRVEDKELRKKLVYDLIEHMFILNIGFTQDLYECLDYAIAHETYSNSERIQLILKVKHFNRWFHHRIKGLRRNQNIHKLFSHILNWCYSQLQNLRNLRKLSTEDLCITIYLLTLWRQDNFFSPSELDWKIMQKLPLSLKTELKLHILVDQLINQSSHSPNILSSIFNLIDFPRRQRLHFFLFVLYEFNIYLLSNFAKCDFILGIFTRNLACPQLLSQLDLPYTSAIMIFSNVKQYLTTFLRFLMEIQLFSTIHFQELIKYGLLNLYIVQIRGRQEYEIYDQLLQRLKTIVQWLDFDKIITKKFKNKMLGHFCINFTNLTSLIVIKQCYYDLVNQSYDIERDLQSIRLAAINNNCDQCEFIFSNFSELSMQNNILCRINKEHKLQEQRQYQFIKSHNKLKKIHEIEEAKKYPIYQEFIFLRDLSLCSFCTTGEHIESKYCGIKQFYLHLKDRSMLNSLLKPSPFYTRLLDITLEAIFKSISLREVCFCLNVLTAFANSHRSYSYSYCLFSAADRFIKQNSSLIDFTQMVIYLEELEPPSEYPRINSIYYLIILFYLPKGDCNKIQIKLVRSFEMYEMKFRRYFVAHYFRFLMIDDLRRWKIQQRKGSWLKKQIVKQFTLLNMKSLTRNVKKGSTRAMNCLQRKIGSWGGVYDLSISDIRPISLTITAKYSETWNQINPEIHE